MTKYTSLLLGMLNTFISWEDTQDPQACNHGHEGYESYSRDPERTPMQWDNTTLAGLVILFFLLLVFVSCL